MEDKDDNCCATAKNNHHFPCNSFPRKSKINNNINNNSAAKSTANNCNNASNSSTLRKSALMSPNLGNNKRSTSPSSVSTTSSAFSSPSSRVSLRQLSEGKKAKRIRFFRNGDKFFKGIVYPLSAEKIRTFDALLEELTRILVDQVGLPKGVRHVYSSDGAEKIKSLEQLTEGQSYVVSSTDNYIRLAYEAITGTTGTCTGYSGTNGINNCISNYGASQTVTVRCSGGGDSLLLNSSSPDKFSASCGDSSSFTSTSSSTASPTPRATPNECKTTNGNSKTASLSRGSNKQRLGTSPAKARLSAACTTGNGSSGSHSRSGSAKGSAAANSSCANGASSVVSAGGGANQHQQQNGGQALALSSNGVTAANGKHANNSSSGSSHSNSQASPQKLATNSSNASTIANGRALPALKRNGGAGKRSCVLKRNSGRVSLLQQRAAADNQASSASSSNKVTTNNAFNSSTHTGTSRMTGQIISENNNKGSTASTTHSAPHVLANDSLIASLGMNSTINILYPREVVQRYEIGLIIGDGNFAVVHECIHRSSRKEFAVKIIDKAKCKGREAMIANEVSILRRVKHKNIIQLTEDFDYANELYLVTELVTGGDLFDAIAEASKYTEADASRMMYNLASALSYLHSINICHRDIKPENLLVCERSKSLKVADFGLAVEMEFGERLFCVCGTPTYVAPEILAETGYNQSVDVWAAGVIAYILLSGFPPFVSAENDQDELFDQILSGRYEFSSPYWDDVSGSAKELIGQMLQIDQDQRLTSHQVLEHPWVARDAPQRKEPSSPLSSVSTKRLSKNSFELKSSLISSVVPCTDSSATTKGSNCSQEDIPLISSACGSLIY